MATLPDKIALITLNCQGLRLDSNRSLLFSWLNCSHFHFICLQETHSISEAEFEAWVQDAIDQGVLRRQYKCISSPGTARSSGVAILYHPESSMSHCSRDSGGRLVCAEFLWGDIAFQLANIYGPNSKRDGDLFFESLYSVLDPDTPLILCGDFNTVVDPVLDRRGCNPSSPWAYNWPQSIAQLTSTFDLHDAWREKHPSAQQYTWHRPNGRQASRLDMFWLSAFFLVHILHSEILPFFRSDHSYVFLELSFPSTQRGRGLWKFNTTHLANAQFIQMIQEFWSFWQTQRSSFVFLSSWWDAGKIRLRQQIRSFCRKQASSTAKRLKSLDATVFHLHRRLSNGDDVQQFLDEANAEIAAIHRDRVRGARIRANVQWAEEGEMSSKYFFGLEKKHGQRRLIGSIKNFAGTTITVFDEIIREWVRFYGSLFSSQSLDLTTQSLFLNALSQKLSSTESASCEGPLSLAECHGALTAMKVGKSPGIDGLPAEFFQRFWDTLGQDYVDVMNYCYDSGRLSSSQGSGVITLLHKRGSRLDMKNWRPITLLCVDYKIAAKVIANRLLSVIHLVVHPDQSCGVPGRRSSDNLRLLHDLLANANTNKIGGAVISLDQEKAFDRVEWSFLERVLETMNFGPSFRQWVALFYTRIFSSVLVNGTLSEFFPVSRGVRQGCPLSPLLYVLVAETVACYIRNDPRIDGYSLPNGKTFKLCQYADDTTIVVRSEASLKAVFAVFDLYERASGAKLNVAKSHGLIFGWWRSKITPSIPLDWSTESIMVLGSQLANDGDELWSKPIKTLTTLLSSWKRRSLSYHGRALVANTLGLSMFWYLASFRIIPVDVIQQINTLIYAFIWQKPREWLARSSFTQRPSQGGLGLVDVACKTSSLHVQWIKRYFTTPDMPWKSFFEQHLRRAFQGRRVHQIIALPHGFPSSMKDLPRFYRAVLDSWFSLPRTTDLDGNVVIRFKDSLVPMVSLSPRQCYRIQLCQQRTQHRCIEKYRSWGFRVEWSLVWLNLHLWRFVRSVRNTNWLIAHAILPTADRLYRYNIAVDTCCHCGQPETLVHLFTSCPFAVSLSAWYFSLLHAYSSTASPPSPCELLVGYGKLNRLPPVFPALLGIIRHHIWLSRNSYKFEGRIPDTSATIIKVKSTLRFNIRVQQRHCPAHTFDHSWLGDGLFGSISFDDDLSFSACLL